GHDEWVGGAAFSPDGKLIASTEMFPPFQALVWDVASHRCITNLTGHDGPVGPVLFAPDGKTVITGSFDRRIRLWDTAAWQVRGVLTNEFEATSLALSPKNDVLAVGGLMGAGDERPEFRTSKRLTFWDVRSLQKLDLLPEAAAGAAAVAFSPDGRLFVTS